MTETLVTDVLRAAVEQRAAKDPEWMAAARRLAFVGVDGTPLPDRVQHLWRYTDPKVLLPGTRVPEEPTTQFGALPEECKDGTFEHHAGIAVALNGRVLRHAHDPQLNDSGLVFGDLRGVAATDPDRVEVSLAAELIWSETFASSEEDPVKTSVSPLIFEIMVWIFSMNRLKYSASSWVSSPEVSVIRLVRSPSPRAISLSISMMRRMGPTTPFETTI